MRCRAGVGLPGQRWFRALNRSSLVDGGSIPSFLAKAVRMRRHLTWFWLFSAVPGLALGQDDSNKADDGARYSKTTTINFEDDTIEGDLSRPDGEYVEARRKVKHSNLIRIREEFKDKVMQSVGEL
jgi:hypothetical protein